MAKRSNFVCQQCGYSQVGWAGKCPNCGAWGSLVETLIPTLSKAGGSKTKLVNGSKPQKLSEIKTSSKSRILTHISELDRVLGGGIVGGQVVLLAGEPGIGKSTILLQVAEKLGSNVFYASGEESATQVKIRSDRLGIKSTGIVFLEETDVDAIIAVLDSLNPKSSLAIIDSIQTMSTTDLSGLSGSVGQVRECASRLLRWAKSNNVPLIMVGHVTKEGSVAGPAVLAHIVDSVLWFEGDKNANLRLLRAVKNRFGPTDEVGIFTMQNNGLESVTDASKLFLTSVGDGVAGSSISSIMEGTRPILVEVQSLTVPTKLAFPRRVTQGIDTKRVELILAVLIRRCGLKLYDQDIFVNIAGGVTVREPGSDMAIALSIASAFLDKPLPKGLLAVGEVGLMGEVRAVPMIEKRLKEAKQQGYTKFATYKEYSYLSAAIRKLLKD